VFVSACRSDVVFRFPIVFAGILAVLVTGASTSAVADEWSIDCDAAYCDDFAEDCCDAMPSSCSRSCGSIRSRLPSMIGDFFGGTPLGIRGSTSLDRLFVFADDLDVPVPLPPVNSVLTVTRSLLRRSLPCHKPRPSDVPNPR